MAPLDPPGTDSRSDGLYNVATQLGVEETDTRLQTGRERSGALSGPKPPWWWSLEYQQSWTARREVDQLPNDMFREGFTFTDTDENFPTAEVMAIVNGTLTPGTSVGGASFRQGYLQLARTLRVDGDKAAGSVMVAIVDDGLDPIEPLDYSRINAIEGFEILDRGEISPWLGNGLSRPEHYTIGDITANLRPGQVIHVSRLFVHPGVILSRREMRARNWWGASVLELLQRERRGAEESAEYQRGFMQRCSYDVEIWAGLNEILQSKDEDGTPNGEAMVTQRLKVNQRLSTALGIRLLDGGKSQRENRAGVKEGGRPPDSVQSLARTTGELVPLGEAQLVGWQRGTKMPRSIAFMEPAGGLSSGENGGDWQSWGGTVHSEQKSWGTPCMVWMLTLLFNSKQGPTSGNVPAYGIKWNKLRQPTPLEEEQLRVERAKADTLYTDFGWLLPIEGRQARFVDGSIAEISLDSAAFGDEDKDGTGPTDDLALAAAGDDVQRQALNGAQIKSLFELSANVSAGTLPESTALWLITVAIPGIDEAGAARALRAAASFKPSQVETALPSVALDSATSEAVLVELRAEFDAQRFDGTGSARRFLEAWAA